MPLLSKCPRCKTKKVMRVIYMGFPMWFCIEEECMCLFGFWSFILKLVPFNGVLFCYNYHKISYPVALWKWLFDKDTPVWGE